MGAESEPLPLREDSEPLLDCEPERELPEPETLERPPSDSSLLSLAFDVAMAKSANKTATVVVGCLLFGFVCHTNNEANTRVMVVSD